jgi:hypothetical protein
MAIRVTTPDNVNSSLKAGEMPINEFVYIMIKAAGLHPDTTVRINREMIHLIPTKEDENGCSPLVWLKEIVEQMNRDDEAEVVEPAVETFDNEPTCSCGGEIYRAGSCYDCWYRQIE